MRNLRDISKKANLEKNLKKCLVARRKNLESLRTAVMKSDKYLSNYFFPEVVVSLSKNVKTVSHLNTAEQWTLLSLF